MTHPGGAKGIAYRRPRRAQTHLALLVKALPWSRYRNANGKDGLLHSAKFIRPRKSAICGLSSSRALRSVPVSDARIQRRILRKPVASNIHESID